MQSTPQKTGSSFITNLTTMGVTGLSASLGLTLVYPVESVKTIIQLKKEAGQKPSIFGAFNEAVKANGFTTLYKGIPAALIRQFCFAGIRIGLFFNASDYIKRTKNKNTLSVPESAVASLSAAAIGITTVMPLDVIFVRFQAENALSPEQKRGYTSVGNAMVRIIREEGVKTFWRGLAPAIVRAMALNFGMLVPYNKCKGLLAPYLGWTRFNFMLSAAMAGMGASLCCVPFDNMKVRLQKMARGPDGKMPYNGVADCFLKIIRREGVLRLWAGLIPFYMFCAPLSMTTLLLSDTLRVLLGITKTQQRLYNAIN
eukprot:TRINITY_DN109013_c0_g1_i1.p1 TRINITY_DN109013_c0_g1~~TRINITY_DN109013_c0_g1_i1.p1  ORF type:complete len:364 (-),score=30.07 TRINITY_DN109013_c0_g1_i1:173-1111(-)